MAKRIHPTEHPEHDRPNNPPAGLAAAANEQANRQQYAFNPHADPQLHWAGKAERTSFEVPTVSLHTHELIDPARILAEVKKPETPIGRQMDIFGEMRDRPRREAVHFFGHRDGWTNRLVAGDSLMVMNSLLHREAMTGKVQMIYFDPPYGIKYNSNFQPFTDKRDVKDGADADLTTEPEMIRAFRDTWQLGIHSYLSYLRDRLLLARELLADSGSIFVQISDENVHRVRAIMDEVFGAENFVSLISYKTSVSAGSKNLDKICDYVVWYSKNKENIKYYDIFTTLKAGEEGATRYNYIELANGETRIATDEEIETYSSKSSYRLFTDQGLTSRGETTSENTMGVFTFEGIPYKPPVGHWRTGIEGLKVLAEKGRILKAGKTLRFKKYFDDFPYQALSNFWADTGGGIQSRNDPKVYVVQTTTKVIQRCMLMSTDPGDLVLDITCGSGTTAFVAEQWGRRWITCDTSRVALTLAKQRLLTALFPSFRLAQPAQGVDGGFVYKTVPHITLKSIANGSQPEQETLYDQPLEDRDRVRVTGPFTVESLPSAFATLETEGAFPSSASGNAEPVAEALEATEKETPSTGSGAAGNAGGSDHLYYADILRTHGARLSGNQRLRFRRLEPLTASRFLHAEAVLEGDQTALVAFAPEHAAMDSVLVDRILDEAATFRPAPNLLLFCAFRFMGEAQAAIAAAKFKNVQCLALEMDADLQVPDLKSPKKRDTQDAFWLVGQPDVRVSPAGTAPDGQPLYVVELLGFDYVNPLSGGLTEGYASLEEAQQAGMTDEAVIRAGAIPEGLDDETEAKLLSAPRGGGYPAAIAAMWLLDTDYDGRSLYPSQIFLPLAGEKDGWNKLARNLKAELNPDLVQQLHSTRSLPFVAGPQRRIAVKVIDRRGIESMCVIHL